MLNKSNLNPKSIVTNVIEILLILGLLILPMEKIIGHSKITFQTLFILSRFKIWLVLMLIYLYVTKVKKSDFLLWKDQNYSFVYYLKSIFLTLLTLLGGMILISIILKLTGSNLESEKTKQIIQLMKGNYLLLVFTCLTAGITEELIFRGYLIPKLQLFFKNITYPILISSFLFGMMHYGYGTFAQIVGPMLIGILFSIHYYKYRNIKILIVCHFLWDFTILILQMYK